ncbi:recombination mediator RecR [Psittacicella gerlachiana]|uniref:Recombination protein RecR n=1 Tax=Psittacicella gerlachiana TaxID=2028574 RepID=A0A3A1YAZ0_9GAMM|nr:recombination mediator RecR [Psittacicella gerlachiana]RIY34370.1 recombination protein RecR [Psittacicella gerlachiana]
MSNDKIISDLINKFAKLPTIGRKSSTKIIYSLLQQEDRSQIINLANALQHAAQTVQHCRCCNTLTENDFCAICQNGQRLATKKAIIVSSPLDIENIEAFAVYDGIYFVLNDLITPLEGIGPEQAGIPLFINFLKTQQIKEVIIALSTSAEGDATSQFIQDICYRLNIDCYKFATGLPSGVNLSNVDANTVFNSFLNRTRINFDKD